MSSSAGVIGEEIGIECTRVGKVGSCEQRTCRRAYNVEQKSQEGGRVEVDRGVAEGAVAGRAGIRHHISNIHIGGSRQARDLARARQRNRCSIVRRTQNVKRQSSVSVNFREAT